MNDEELQQLNEKMKPLLFPGIMDKLSVLDEKCTMMSEKVVQTNRRATYYYFSTDNAEYPNRILSTQELFTCAAKEPSDALRIFEPLEVQSITMLLKSLISDPPRFVQGVLNASNKQNLKSLAFMTIPAVFAFYSTKETAGFAFHFYVELCRKVSFDAFCFFAYPFFNSASCTIFSNLVFNELFWGNFESGVSEHVFVQKMLILANKYLKYLPEANFKLIQMIILQKGQIEGWKFLARVILYPQYRLASQVSAFSYNPMTKLNDNKIKAYLYQIDTQNPRKPKKSDFELPILNCKSSYFEIPDTFIPYDHSFALDIILVQADIQNLMSMGIDVPHHTQRLNSISQNTTVDPYTPFRLHFFPKMLVPPPFQYRSLFNFPPVYKPGADSQLAQLWSAFENASAAVNRDPLDLIRERPIRTGEALLDLRLNDGFDARPLRRFGLEKRAGELTATAKILENLLQHNMALSTQTGWLLNSEAHSFDAAMAAAARHLSGEKLRPEYLAGHFWTEVEAHACGLKDVAYWTSLILLGKVEGLLMKQRKREIADIEGRYRRLTTDLKHKIDFAPRFPSAKLKEHMFQTNVLLQFADARTPLLTRYIVLMCYIEEIMRLASAGGFEDDCQRISEILRFSLADGSYTWIIRTVITLEAALFNDSHFSELCGTAKFDKWRRFTASFIQFMADDAVLITNYGMLASGQGPWLL